MDDVEMVVRFAHEGLRGRGPKGPKGRGAERPRAQWPDGPHGPRGPGAKGARCRWAEGGCAMIGGDPGDR